MSPSHTRKTKVLYRSEGTETTEGFIPHLELMFDGGILHAPVCTRSFLRGNKGELEPMRREGKLVYALPGGGRYVA